ncbi:EamA family transporter [Candidatus Fermentibacterales bacterium]|nr:EamA family transporter [Candidatus Fermentibacterales bacterium]
MLRELDERPRDLILSPWTATREALLDDNRRAVVLGLTAVLLWSTAASAFKISLRYTTPFMLLFCSSAVSLIVLLVWNLARCRVSRADGSNGPRRDLIALAALRGLLNPFLYYLVLFEAYYRLPAQIAMVVNYLWPVSLVLLSIPLLGQRIGAGRLLAILLSFCGVMVLALGNSSSGSGTDMAAMALALASTVIWALFWVLSVRNRGREAVKLLLGFVFGLCYLSVYGLVRGCFRLPPLEGILGAAWVGVFEMGLTYLIWLRALSLAETSARVGSLIYLTPFLSLLWIAVATGEAVTPATVGGLLLVVGGIAAGARLDRVRVSVR